MMYVWWLDRIHIVLGNILFHRFFADYYHLWQIRIAGRNITSTHSLLYFSFIFVIKKKKADDTEWARAYTSVESSTSACRTESDKDRPIGWLNCTIIIFHAIFSHKSSLCVCVNCGPIRSAQVYIASVQVSVLFCSVLCVFFSWPFLD